MSDVLWEQAITAYADETVKDVNRFPDECGEPTLVRYDLHDGSYVIVGEEPDGGYTWSLYDAEDEFISTTGGPDVADFPAELARLATAARRSMPVSTPGEQL